MAADATMVVKAFHPDDCRNLIRAATAREPVIHLGAGRLTAEPGAYRVRSVTCGMGLGVTAELERING